jgi:hypothetical protein
MKATEPMVTSLGSAPSVGTATRATRIPPPQSTRTATTSVSCSTDTESQTPEGFEGKAAELGAGTEPVLPALAAA